MQLIFDILYACWEWISSIRALMVLGFSLFTWYFVGPLMEWASGGITDLPGVGAAFSVLKDHLWAGWDASAGGYYTADFLEGVHYFIGLGVLRECAGIVASCAVGVLMFRFTTKLIPGLG